MEHNSSMEDDVLSLRNQLAEEQEKVSSLKDKLRYLVRVVEQFQQQQKQTEQGLSDARERADRIIADAEKNAAVILEKAKVDAANLLAKASTTQQNAPDENDTDLFDPSEIAKSGILSGRQRLEDKCREINAALSEFADLYISEAGTIRGIIGKIDENMERIRAADVHDFAPLAMAEVTESSDTDVVSDNEGENEPSPEPETAPTPHEPKFSETLYFDIHSFEALRKDIDDLAAEKYIPGQEDPTIVARDIRDIPVKAIGDLEVSVSEPTPTKDPIPSENGSDDPDKETDDDDGVHFSLFHRK